MLKGVGPAALRLIATSSNLLEENRADVVSRVPRLAKLQISEANWLDAVELAQRQRERAELTDVKILSQADPSFPSLLSSTKDAPFFLWIKGRLSENPKKSVAVIGTRKPTHHGELIAQRITSYLVSHGVSVVSGLALGCDATAHRAALAANGHTVAVLAHGLQTISPSSHKVLAEEIIESGGALVSEFAFGVEPIPAQFVRRDRTQAGLSRGVVMVQSDWNGGSLHASRAAISYGRWLAVPFPTERDRDARESKIQANLTLSSGTEAEKLELLKCNRQDLKHLIVLFQKEDYPSLLTDKDPLDSAPPSHGPDLL